MIAGMGLRKGTCCGVALVVFLLTRQAAAAPSFFAYVSDRRIITVETASATELVLNVINLTDEIMVVHPYDLLVRQGSQEALGHVFRRDGKEPVDPFFATRLVKPREFVGMTVVGAVGEDPEGVVFRSASRFFFLQRMDKESFDGLERKIGQIELGASDAERTLRNAGISEGYGTLQSFPEGETESLERLFPEPGQVLAPRVIFRRDPRAPEGIQPAAEVEVRGLVSKKGDLLDAKVTRGISVEADSRALNTVRNSWKFLPAVRDGDVVDASVTLRVRFIP